METNNLELYELMFDELPILVFLKDVDKFEFKFINKNLAKLLGDEKKNILGKTDFDLFSKEVASKFRKDDIHLISSLDNKIQKDAHFTSIDKSNEYWTKTTKTLLRVEGKPKYILGISEDVTEYKKTTEILKNKFVETKRQQDFLQDTINRLPGVFYSKDVDGNFLYVNNKFNLLLNKENKEIIGKNNYDLFPKEVADQFRKYDLEIINNKEETEIQEFAEDANGNKRIYQSFKFPYIDEDKNVYATGGISLDVTKLKNLEEDNLKQSKLAAIGEMATSLSHEINNPLTNIMGLIYKIKKTIKKTNPELSEKYEQDFEKVKSSTNRITNILGSLKLISRTSTSEESEFDVERLIIESIDLIQNLSKNSNISFDFKNNIKSDSINLRANLSNIQQSLLSLINNAIDSLLESKFNKITVGMDIDSGKNLLISVIDTGGGIPSEQQAKIFDAFYTTKDVNKGAGIGLSIIQRIANDHSGKIELITSNEEGSHFQLLLPANRLRLSKK